MLLMVEKSVRGGICHSFYQYAKVNNKYLKDFDKNKESSYFQYWDVNNLYGWAMPRQLAGSGQTLSGSKILFNLMNFL